MSPVVDVGLLHRTVETSLLCKQLAAGLLHWDLVDSEGCQSFSVSLEVHSQSFQFLPSLGSEALGLKQRKGLVNFLLWKHLEHNQHFSRVRDEPQVKEGESIWRQQMVWSRMEG